MRVAVGALGVALLLASSSLAHAGSYLAFGLGSEAAPGVEITSDLGPDELSVARLAAGYRLGPLALEASVLTTGIRDTASGDETESLGVGVDVKYFIGLAGGLELYGRGGLGKAWLRGDSAIDVQSTGRSYNLGGGLQYTFGPLPLARASLWLDYTHRMPRGDDGETGGGASGPEASLGNAANVTSIGVSIGF